jgi:hypothetical protein
MKVKIGAAIHVRDDEKSTNRLSPEGAIVGQLVYKIIPPWEEIDLAEDEARRLLDAFPNSWEVGTETEEQREWLQQLEKQPRGVPRQAPTRPSMQGT